MKASINNRHLNLEEIMMIGPLELDDEQWTFEVLWKSTGTICKIPVIDENNKAKAEEAYNNFVSCWLVTRNWFINK